MIYLFVIEGLLTIAILFARWFLFSERSNFGDFEKSAWLLLNQAATDGFAVFTHEESGVEFRFTKRFGNGRPAQSQDSRAGVTFYGFDRK